MFQETLQANDSIVSSLEEFDVLVKALTDITTLKQEEQRRKRVCFANELSTSSAPPKHDISCDELKSLWYDALTISNFRTEARKLAFSTYYNKNVNNDNNNHNNKNLDSATGTSTRGLEGCSFERQLRRHKTRQCILSSYKKGFTLEQTAVMYQQCSAWNRHVALVQACHDYLEVYQPPNSTTMAILLPKICQTPPAFPFELRKRKKQKNNKRAPSSDDEGDNSNCPPLSRRVRRRKSF